MDGESGVSVKNDIQGKGASYYSLLGIIRSVLEKHGGTMKVDEDTNTIVLSIPRDKKKACYQALEGMLDEIKLFVRLVPFQN
jgi:hypothetical protein